MNIGIVGIGCIGSSLARDFIAQGLGTIHICDSNPEFLRDAEKLGLGQTYTSDLTVLAKHTDIIFICAPVMAIPDIIRALIPHMKEGGIITDVGSVKGFVVDAVSADIPSHIHYIPAHPVTFGTTGTGPSSGREGVFAGCKYILTPCSSSNQDGLNIVANIARQIGAEPIEMTPEQHDRILGFTSHLSHVIAFSTMQATGHISRILGQDVMDYAGGSFKDMTRVAASDARMWRDIFLSNRDQIQSGLDALVQQIEILNTLMQNNDAEALEKFITDASDMRRTRFE